MAIKSKIKRLSQKNEAKNVKLIFSQTINIKDEMVTYFFYNINHAKVCNIPMKIK